MTPTDALLVLAIALLLLVLVSLPDRRDMDAWRRALDALLADNRCPLPPLPPGPQHINCRCVLPPDWDDKPALTDADVDGDSE